MMWCTLMHSNRWIQLNSDYYDIKWHKITSKTSILQTFFSATRTSSEKSTSEIPDKQGFMGKKKRGRCRHFSHLSETAENHRNRKLESDSFLLPPLQEALTRPDGSSPTLCPTVLLVNPLLDDRTVLWFKPQKKKKGKSKFFTEVSQKLWGLFYSKKQCTIKLHNWTKWSESAQMSQLFPSMMFQNQSRVLDRSGLSLILDPDWPSWRVGRFK